MKGQVIAIILVIVSGVGTFVMLRSNMHSLITTKDAFYADYGFADIFASVKRAPESIAQAVSEIPGVDVIETRVSGDAKLSVPDFHEPVSARLVSVPDNRASRLNRLFLRTGRMPEPWKDNEAVVNEAFADAHGISPGAKIGAVINGRWKTVIITGIALCPEFVLQAKPGSISPDYKRYAILWMGREALSSAYNMKGAFNDISLTLRTGTNPKDMIDRLDNIIAPYGGIGSYERKDQISNRFLSEEFRQLQRSSQIFPTIFIIVSAFLLNVVVSRTISIQRDQIAILKAFGYGNAVIALHYAMMVFLICAAGIAGGIALGVWLGRSLGKIYMEFYRFPYLMYELKAQTALTAAFVTTASALIGTMYSVWKAASLSPAAAMMPEPPAKYRKSLLEYSRLWNFLAQPTRIIVRNIERRPIKSMLTIMGISLGCAILLAGTFSTDAIDFMIDVQFNMAQKEDMTVTFIEPSSYKALYELKGMQGVAHAEVFRSAPVRLKHKHRLYKTSLSGINPSNKLHYLLNTSLKPIAIPPDGIILTDYLAALMDISPGDIISVEVLEGNRPIYKAPVAGIVKEYIGVGGYMHIDALNRLLREDSAISGAYLTVDPLYQREIYRKLADMPRVAGVSVRKDEIRNFYETQAEFFLFFTMITTILSGVIAFGVIYNSARIALSERSRELASLRVLGYTRAEISYIFLGEITVLTLAAIPIGFVIGKALCTYIAGAISSDLFRVPVIVEPATYSLAAATILVSACVSGLIVRRKLDRLDLVAVLKTRE